MKTSRLRVLLVTPPMMQLNTAYPAVPLLTGFLRSRGYPVAQADASLELALRLFSRRGLETVRDEVALTREGRVRHASVRRFLDQFDRYAATVEPAVAFLQSRDPDLAARIVTRRFLPEGPRFQVIGDWDTALRAAGLESEQPLLDWRFGELGLQDRARYLASLYIDDLSDVIRGGIDGRFELSRYAEKLSSSLTSFEPLRRELERPPTLIDRMIDELAAELAATHRAHLVGFTIPFPGCLYAALRMARRMKRDAPRLRVVMGGGYVNTELRALSDPGLFEFVDYVALDDGEAPMLGLLRRLERRGGPARLVRTFALEKGRVRYHAGRADSRVRKGGGEAVFDGMGMDRRIGIMEVPNAAFRLWSDGRWNKMMLAHGCYWHRCAFCDTSLDYICRYQPESAGRLVDRMEAVMGQTGHRGFHFVDEAAPPALLRAVAEELLRRRLSVAWWGNIRFERAFTPALAERLAESGCIALTGGLETVCDRTLTAMRKGVRVEGAIRAAGALSAAGILVHAYLMYGFPSQTTGETVDALEIVRQMFECGCLQSAYWHRFALTAHSAMAAAPEAFGIRLLPAPPSSFARNEIPYEDPVGDDPEPLAAGLRKAVYNFLHGVGFDRDVTLWFDAPVPRPRVPRRFVSKLL